MINMAILIIVSIVIVIIMISIIHPSRSLVAAPSALPLRHHFGCLSPYKKACKGRHLPDFAEDSRSGIANIKPNVCADIKYGNMNGTNCSFDGRKERLNAPLFPTINTKTMARLEISE